MVVGVSVHMDMGATDQELIELAKIKKCIYLHDATSTKDMDK